MRECVHSPENIPPEIFARVPPSVCDSTQRTTSAPPPPLRFVCTYIPRHGRHARGRTACACFIHFAAVRLFVQHRSKPIALTGIKTIWRLPNSWEMRMPRAPFSPIEHTLAHARSQRCTRKSVYPAACVSVTHLQRIFFFIDGVCRCRCRTLDLIFSLNFETAARCSIFVCTADGQGRLFFSMNMCLLFELNVLSHYGDAEHCSAGRPNLIFEEKKTYKDA